MAECARCGRNVDDLRIITPDVVTKELMDTIDDSEGGLTGGSEMKACAKCIDELTGD